MIARRMCDFLATILITGTLYTACLEPVTAQNVTCATRPAGDNSNACASTAFVQNSGAGLIVGTSTIVGGTASGVLYNNAGILGNSSTVKLSTLLGVLDVTGLTSLKDISNAASSGFIVSGAALNVFGGNQIGNPTTSEVPTAFITRTETISTGSANTSLSASLLVLNAANSQNVGGADSTQNNGISIIASKDAASTGNTAGVISFAYTNGTSGTSFAYYGACAFYNVAGTTGCIGLELDVTNASGTARPYVPGSFTAWPAVGIDINYGGTSGGSTQVGGGPAVLIRAAGGATMLWDVGIGFWPNAIKIADMQSDSSATHILFANTGAHTNGINLSGATFSNKAYLSPGASISGTGAGAFTGLTVTSSFTATGLVTNAALANPATTVNGQTCTLGSTCTVVAAATSVAIGTTTITGGTPTRVLYDNAGILGEYSVSGSGNVAMTTNTVLTTPALGTPSSVTLTSATGLPISTGLTGTGTGVLTALAINVGSAGAFVTFNGALGTPSSGTVTNLTGTASININGTVGAGSPTTGAFTTLTGTGGTHTGITSLGIRDTSAAFDVTLAAVSSSALGAGRTLTFDVGNVAHTLKLGTTANTITFPNAASDTVAMLGVANSFSAVQTITNATAGGAGTGALVLTAGGLSVSGIINQGGGQFIMDGANQQLSLGGVATLTRNGGTGQVTINSNAGDVLLTPGSGIASITGTLNISAVANDTATVDNTLCISGTGRVLKGTGALGVCLGTSSLRFKERVKPLSDGLIQIAALQPKNFFYKKGFGDDGARQQYGFIAEDVVKVLPKLTGLDVDGRPQTVDMLGMVPVLVSAFQQLKADNDNLTKEVTQLRKAK